MPGARLILNARYFHIAKAGEKADGKHVMTKDAAMGLVNYVGTRESVILNLPDQLSLNEEEVASLRRPQLPTKKTSAILTTATEFAPARPSAVQQPNTLLTAAR